MQAPTTPNEPPAQEPDQRVCPGCGAGNGLTAAFCWRCYRPFGAQAPGIDATVQTPGGWVRPGVPPAPHGWAQSPSLLQAETPRRNLGTMLGVILVTVAVVGGVVFFLGRNDAVAVPESFGGMPQIDDAQTQLAVEAFRAQVETTGIEGDMVIYGNGVPSAALIWIRDASVPTTDAAFDEFAAGFNQGIGGNGSLGKQTDETVAGVTFVCAPVVGVTPGTICMWQDEDVFWLMFDFSGDGFGARRDLAVVAHDAVDAA